VKLWFGAMCGCHASNVMQKIKKAMSSSIMVEAIDRAEDLAPSWM